MAEKKTGAAKHSADYRDRQKKAAAKLGIEKVFFNMPEGIKAAMAAEIERHGYDQVQELWQDLALSWIAQDPEERARRLERPDAPAFYISPKLAREFEAASMAELKRDPGCEVINPFTSSVRHTPQVAR
ncbi:MULTISPECIES: hypothetical protein [Pseudomonas]|jgi:transketolase|uniref:Uncharacterized protein n=1 Tax=Pseudomonas putida (strain ATCC 47054 / DSM 6125 / CFBP 8728 / NCIMB 11950 / KT2440) TaxID=160488 RepID=Q88MM7_PSEPK|nr:MULTISPECIES: hypothetical protein [Pseudomonas]AAN67165.1 conserved protein of unknown function [Pseudomonas putida KT2440]KMU95670.1 hypothetical protein AC138_13710 [Pseudomonas putida]KMY36353.1 hypothetical protein AA993_07950 [Pseudomonas putida]MDD2078609.1 hypothetical protein [Pseudomonas putida]PXZ52395.1 hypothetical protein DM483_06715 [Pseudomonas sp. SMT-1]